jgi:5-formyltetrahydrofolate cyclo-ligase
MDDKATIRKRMRMVREMVDDHLLRSVQLWAAVAELPEFRQAASVMAFKGFGSEPDTDPLFARLAAEGKRLLLPRIDDGAIVVCDGDGPTARSRIGVDEPQGEPLPFDVVDFVIVPGLAFTPEGYRLGYGGGFYDRFLPQVPAPNAGVCFAEQIVTDLPVEAHDVRVHRVVSA